MSDKNKVKEFWQSRAKEKKAADQIVTHRDIWQRSLEIEMIKKFLSKKDRVLDIGCGNGYTTKIISPLVSEIIGMDYSDEMIKRANKNYRPNKKKAIFKVGDVLSLNSSTLGLFDVVISERCLINLKDWNDQKKAITNIATVLKPGGRFIFVEGCQDGRNSLNSMRQKYGLPKMPKVWHNVDFLRDQTITFLEKFFKIKKDLHFGVFDFLARVIHPLLVLPKEPKYDAKINQIAAKLAVDNQEFQKISRILFLVLSKKKN